MRNEETAVRINEIRSIEINDLGVHGEGIGRVDGFTVLCRTHFLLKSLKRKSRSSKILRQRKAVGNRKNITIQDTAFLPGV
ncbi:MAG: hypothetical protein ACLR1D_04090 [Dialister sp.]